MKCDQCAQHPQFIVVYGCLNEHIHEHTFCVEHYLRWEDEPKICVECGAIIYDWVTRDADKVKHG